MNQLKLAGRLNKKIPEVFEGIQDKKVIELAEKYQDVVMEKIGFDMFLTSLLFPVQEST